MKKLYLLPLSMILMTAGYADEPQQAQSENVAQEEIVQTPDAQKDVVQQAAAAPGQAPGPHGKGGPKAPKTEESAQEQKAKAKAARQKARENRGKTGPTPQTTK